jgi:hypothetical protein
VDDTPATTTRRRRPVDQCPLKDNPTTSDDRLLPEKGRPVPAGGWLGSELLVVVPDSVDSRAAVAVGTTGGGLVVTATLLGATTDVGATTGDTTAVAGATTGGTAAVVGTTTGGTTGGTTTVVGATTGGATTAVGATTGGTTTVVGTTTGGATVVVARTGGGELAAVVATATGDGLTTPPDDESSGHVLGKKGV